MKHLIPITAALAFALAGCGDTEPAGEASDNAASTTPVKADAIGPSANATDMSEPLATEAPGPGRTAEGSWTGKTMAGAPAALFGPPRTEASFSVRCEDQTLVFSRSALLPAGEAAMRLSAGGKTRNLSANSTPDPLPQVTARLPAADPFAGTLARSDGSIAVSVGGGERFTMPSSPLIRGVVADCMAA